MYSGNKYTATDKISQGVASSLEGLNFFLDGFDTCFHLCIEQGDRVCFRFCMQRLFVSIDTLYLVMLPDLQATVSQKEASPRVRYQVWTCLRDLKRLIEHIEPLCQLLNSLATTMLEALDLHTDQMSDDTSVWKPEAPTDRAHADISRKDIKERAFTALAECLNDWRRYYSYCLYFSVRFAKLFPLESELARIDAALDALLDYAGPLFGEVLPAFSIEPIDPTIAPVQVDLRERIVVHLLDMMQKIDLVLVQTSILLDAFYSLLQYHASASAVYSQPEENGLNTTITVSKPFS